MKKEDLLSMRLISDAKNYLNDRLKPSRLAWYAIVVKNGSVHITIDTGTMVFVTEAGQTLVIENIF